MKNDDEPDQQQEQPEEGHPLPGVARRKSSVGICCDICFEPYHILTRWPMEACPNRHTFCDSCIKGLFVMSDEQPVACPACRALVMKASVKPHYELFRQINKESKLKDVLLEEDQELFLYAFRYSIFEIAILYKEANLEAVHNLKQITASNRSIQTIQHFGGLKHLQILHMDHNSIASIADLSQLHSLKILNLNHNRIQSIAPLQQLDQLEVLSLEYNRIRQVQNPRFFRLLKHWLLYGNPLCPDSIKLIFDLEHEQQSSISLPVSRARLEELVPQLVMYLSFNFPKLERLVLQAEGQQKGGYAEKIVFDSGHWVNVLCLNSDPRHPSCLYHQQWTANMIKEHQLYGDIFRMQLDETHPFLDNYKLESGKLTKTDCIFTAINSATPITKKGRQTFKIRMLSTSPNIYIGICNAFVRHDVNIHSDHFVGLALWGLIYDRITSSNVLSRIREEDRPTIRMTVDFEEGRISWYSDVQLVGEVPFPQQFRHSTLYFVIGIRDIGVSVQLMDA